MKRTTFIIITLLLLFISQKSKSQAFQSGEEITFKMYYGFVTGGTATLSLMETKINGREIYYARAVAKTVGVANSIYNVYDVYSSFFDKETCLPIKDIRDVTEGNYKRYNEVTYNHDKQVLTSQKSGKHNFEGKIFDIVSAFYYARKENLFANLAINETIKIPTYFTDEFWDLEIRFKGYETIETNLGTIRCMKFVPLVEPGRVFDREDDLKIWISDDSNYIPIRIQMDLIVGSFKGDLVSYKNLVTELKFED